MADRQGVEIDHCPVCRGVWLDRGELDKLLDRAATPPAAPARVQAAPQRADFQDSDYQGRSDHDYHRHPQRKKSWLSEIFD
jgi:Zn-finger nucleic acid-binding protein